MWAVLYLAAVFADLYKRLSGKTNSSAFFADLDDTVFYLGYIAVVTFIFIGLLKSKPK